MARWMFATVLYSIVTSVHTYAIPSGPARDGCAWVVAVGVSPGAVASLVQSCSGTSPVPVLTSVPTHLPAQSGTATAGESSIKTAPAGPGLPPIVALPSTPGSSVPSGTSAAGGSSLIIVPVGPKVPPVVVLPPVVGSPAHTTANTKPNAAISDTRPANPPISPSTTNAVLPTSDAHQVISTDLNAFAATAPAVTTVSAGGLHAVWTRSSFANLLTITAPTTVTTGVAFTATNGHQTTTSAAIVVGPAGIWWTRQGGAQSGGACVWPFCHLGDGGNIGGGCVWPFCSPGSGVLGGGNGGAKPTRPAEVPVPTKPGADNEPPKPTSEASPTEKATSTSTSSSCQKTVTASDCSVACSTPTGASTITCATKCFSTISGCDVTGSTTTTTSSACTKAVGWASVGIGSGLNLQIVPASTTSAGTNTRSGDITPPTGKPTCMADGAPWYSPTSWCDCGSTGTYATLQPTLGAKTANCAYVTLPSSTLKPTVTGTRPTNIPGMNGLGACHGILSTYGTSAYCDCDGTPAPTLAPTSLSYINCAYTIKPTSFYDPKIPLTASTASSSSAIASATQSPYAAGQCGLHVWEAHGAHFGDPPVALIVTIKDANGNVIGQNHSILDWPAASNTNSKHGSSMSVDSKLPNVLSITPRKKLTKRGRHVARLAGPIPPWPTYKDSSLEFTYGSEKWLQSDAQCTVGGWDGGDLGDFLDSFLGANFLLNRQMDCGFPCPAPNDQKRWSGVSSSQRIDRELDTRFVTPSLGAGQQLEARGKYSKEYYVAAKKGAELYQAWRAKTGPDKDTLCDLDQRYMPAGPYVSESQPQAGLREILQSNGINVKVDYYAIDLVYQGNDRDHLDYPQWANAMSPEAGVILAMSNSRGTPKVPEDASAIHWWEWQKTVKTKSPETSDFSGLSTYVRFNIANSGTLNILWEAVAGQGEFMTNSVTFYPANPSQEDNPFWAILGTDNGKGIQYLLTDYKQGMRSKGILSIQVQLLGSEWMFWANIG